MEGLVIFLLLMTMGLLAHSSITWYFWMRIRFESEYLELKKRYGRVERH